jgi:hypothetical protein
LPLSGLPRRQRRCTSAQTESREGLGMRFTAAELALLRRALTIPGCWNPRVRAEALRLVERAEEQLSLLAEGVSA